MRYYAAAAALLQLSIWVGVLIFYLFANTISKEKADSLAELNSLSSALWLPGLILWCEQIIQNARPIWKWHRCLLEIQKHLLMHSPKFKLIWLLEFCIEWKFKILSRFLLVHFTPQSVGCGRDIKGLSCGQLWFSNISLYYLWHKDSGENTTINLSWLI